MSIHVMHQSRLPRTLCYEPLEAKLCLSGGGPFEFEIVVGDVSDAYAQFASNLYASSALSNNGTIVSYEGNSQGTFGPHNVLALVADLNDDGNPDVIVAVSGKIVWYENSGHGTFGPVHTIAANVHDPVAVLATDVDGDEDIDIIVAVSGKIVWYENMGHGTFGSQTVVATKVGDATSLQAVDSDGDGTPDLLIAGDHEFSWNIFGEWDVPLDSLSPGTSTSVGSVHVPTDPFVTPIGEGPVTGTVNDPSVGSLGNNAEVTTPNSPGDEGISSTSHDPLDSQLGDKTFEIERSPSDQTSDPSSSVAPKSHLNSSDSPDFDPSMLGDPKMTAEDSSCPGGVCPPSGSEASQGAVPAAGFGPAVTFMADRLAETLYGAKAADSDNDRSSASRANDERYERRQPATSSETGSRWVRAGEPYEYSGNTVGRGTSRPVKIPERSSAAPSPSDPVPREAPMVPPDDPAAGDVPVPVSDTVPGEPDTDVTVTPRSMTHADISAEPVGQESAGILSRILAGLVAGGGALLVGSWGRKRAKKDSATVSPHGSPTSRGRNPIDPHGKSSSRTPERRCLDVTQINH